MLYKVLAAAFLVANADALNVNPVGLTRRAAVGAAAAVLPLAPLAAFAELQRSKDADIYKRADSNKMTAARAIERAREGNLANGSSATCAELDTLIAVDREAIQYQKERAQVRKAKKNTDFYAPVKDPEEILQEQVEKLKAIRREKGCESASANLKQATDFEVYKRADEDVLNAARVIERAKVGKLVDGSGASCAELEKIILINRKAVKFEKDKIEALEGMADPAQITVVRNAENAIEAQILKLQKLQKDRKCI
jgi:ribosomal protein L27